MSILKRENGTYVVRWTEGGKKRGRTFDRRRDAEKFEAEARRRKAMGGLVIIPERITLEELYTRYVAAKAHREKNTLDGYAAMWTHLAPRLGRVPVQQISPATVEALGAEMVRDGVGATSANKAIGMLSSMMNRAIVWGYLERNPCQHVDRPRAARRRRVEAPSPAGIEAIRSRMKIRDATLVSVLAYAGLRPGEALALTWEDVGNAIHVDKAVAHGRVKTTKNRRGRSIALLPSLKRDLDEYRLAVGRPESGLVFPNDRDEPWTDAQYRNWRSRYFRPAATAAGFPGMRVYDCRHTYASLLMASQLRPVEVAYEMGHTVEVLLSTYSHLIAEFRGRPAIDPDVEIQTARLAAAA